MEKDNLQDQVIVQEVIPEGLDPQQIEKRRQEVEEKLKEQEEQDKEKEPAEDQNLIEQNFAKQLALIKQQRAHGSQFDKQTNKDDIEKHFDRVFEQFKALREYVANYAFCIPSYTLQTYQQTLDTMNDELVKERENALPKKKFSFVRKGKTDQPKATQQKEQPEQVPTQTVNSFIGNHLSIKEIQGQTIRKTEAEYEGKENVIIEDLLNCEVFLPFKIKSLYIKNIKDTKIFVGCVSGASFVNEAVDCDIHLCSQQIRIHNSSNTSFYLVAKSNPIIEHCKGMRFGKYTCTYQSLEQHQKETQLFEIKSFWDKVLDFNWHKQDKSPNWDPISEDEEVGQTPIAID